MVLHAEPLAAEAPIALQRSSDFTGCGRRALSRSFESETGARLQPGKHRIAVILAAGLLTSLLMPSVHAHAYPTQYLPTVWQTEQGLPQNSVTALLQDHNGYLWIGTFGGLARFDGERFRVLDAAGTPGFDNNNILSLYQNRSGVLWIGTVAGGLFRLENGVATKYTDGLPSSLISSILGDAEGGIWANTSEGVAHFDGAKWEAHSTHRGKSVRDFYLQARDGSMWFRSGTDLVRFDPGGSIATLHVRKPSAFLVQEARDGSVWIAVRDEYRLVRYSQGVFSDVPLPSIPRPEWMAYPEYVLAMAENTHGDLLLLTPAGLVRIVDGKVNPPEPVSLPANDGELAKVRTLLVDREGNLWVGMIGKGLVRLRPAPLMAYAKQEGLSDSSFSTVFQDREGRIWLGGDLLYWFDGHRFHLLPGAGDIMSIAQTRDGDLWFGGYGGLYRWRSGVLSRFKVEALPVKSIYQDREGTLWIGVPTEERRGGLYRFREGKLDQIPGIAGVLKILDDRDGGLWVAASEGLFRVRGGKASLYEQKKNLPAQIVELYQDSTGTLWFATYGRGLFRFRDGRLQAITTKDGLPNNILGTAWEDGKGNLWVGSNHGIFRLRLKDLNDFADGKIPSIFTVTYDAAEGMRSSECNGGNPGAWQTTDGRMWFPTMRGVVAIDPDAGSRLPPPIVLEEARADKVMLAREGQTSAPAGNNTFDFRFTALSLSAPEKLRFRYRLEPYDKDWVDAGPGHTAHYTNMAPGNYSFHVIAANSYGVWNEQGASLRFVLRPHFYQTSWFYALCSTTFLALLWLGHQFRLRQLQQAFTMRMEERVEERTRIARELHDTLLQSFQALTIFFQAARNLLPGRTEEAIRTLDEAIGKADEAVAEGRDAIQNLRLRPARRRLEDLLTATVQELRDAQDGNSRSAVFQMIIEGEPRTLSPLLEDEIYRIAREVLRNAFQHACASRIEAAIHYDSNLFRLRIRDDGKGIDAAVLQEGASAGHWGLPGIRERAKRIGARFALSSGSGAGTEVELTVPASVAFAKTHVRRRLGLFRIKSKTS
jgi:signal transduction histidine kinase/ligand-binding sensor domain-containing protein